MEICCLWQYLGQGLILNGTSIFGISFAYERIYLKCEKEHFSDNFDTSFNKMCNHCIYLNKTMDKIRTRSNESMKIINGNHLISMRLHQTFIQIKKYNLSRPCQKCLHLLHSVFLRYYHLSTSTSSDNCVLHKFTKYFCYVGHSTKNVHCFFFLYFFLEYLPEVWR